MKYRYIYLIILILTAALNCNAKTVIWSVKPMYETIKPYSQTLYLCQLNGKWGLIDSKGETVLPNNYDFITSQRNGIGLFGVVEGNRHRLNGLIDSEGKCTSISGKYYVVPSFPYFSEGKLCISNSSGKQGFMDETGNIVIKCQFNLVRPFMEGLASIKKGPWVYYIRDNYDASPGQNVVYSEWRNGQITEGTSFNNGEAVVGYGGKYKVIDTNGRELRDYNASKLKINPTDYTAAYGNNVKNDVVETFKPEYSQNVQILSENGKFGFRADNEIILPPVLSSVSPVDMNMLSIAEFNGKSGLLRIIDERIEASLLIDDKKAERILVKSGGKTDMLDYVITIPEQYMGHSILMVDKGNGYYEDVSASVVTEGNKLTFGFYPEITDKENIKRVKYKIIYEGMEIMNQEFDILIERPVILRLSEPFVKTAQADIKTEIQEVAATIFNDASRDVNVTATLSVNCTKNSSITRSFNISIPAGTSRTVIVPVTVRNDENVSAIIKLSSGEYRRSTVALKIY